VRVIVQQRRSLRAGRRRPSREQHVCGLHIQVHDSLLMHVRERRGELRSHRECWHASHTVGAHDNDYRALTHLPHQLRDRPLTRLPRGRNVLHEVPLAPLHRDVRVHAHVRRPQQLHHVLVRAALQHGELKVYGGTIRLGRH
jgi:hypothetical protein